MHYQYIKTLLLYVWMAFEVGLSFAQPATTPWHSYTDHRTNLRGYKDASGKVRIPAKFGGLTDGCLFRNIIAVTEGSSGRSYYLLKSGKKVAEDSLYIYDMTYDHEQEDKVRFHDPKRNQVGFLAKNGKVVIPASFNDATPFYNGIALVIHHGRRLCGNGEPYNDKAPCEHWYWAGVTALIDARGRIIADRIQVENTNNLNWYSLRVSRQPADTALRISFKGLDHAYYSFISYEKEFKKWFYQRYLTNLSKSALQQNCFKVLSAEGLFKTTLRKFYSRPSFINTYYSWLRPRLAMIRAGKMETTFLMDDLNNLTYDQPAFKAFYNDCGEANGARFPSIDVVITYHGKNRQFDRQEHILFLRTGNGYRLIGIAKPTS